MSRRGQESLCCGECSWSNVGYQHASLAENDLQFRDSWASRYDTFSGGSKGSKHFNSAALTFRPSGLWVLSRILNSDRPSFAFPPPAPAAEDAHAPTCAFYNNSCTCARTPTPTPSQHELLQIMLRKKRRAGKKAEKMRKTTR